MKAVILCCGYGTRMGMKSNESKEMLLDKTGYPIIYHSFILCNIYKLNPLVITRKEKTDLIDYCKEHNVETLIIDPKGEWPETILASAPMWESSNILILPDTRFESTRVIEYMKNDIDELNCDYSVAVHKIDESSKWCVTNGAYIVEKPVENNYDWAMGLIAWDIYNGKKLFTQLSERNKYFVFDGNVGFHYLDNFKDVTRTGKLEI